MASIPGTEVEIKSADVGVLTSPGLGELKQLINEATVRRRELLGALVKGEEALDRAASRLRWAESPVIRLFTERLIPRLVEAANKAHDELDETKAHLDGCFVEVDFAFDDAMRSAYAALIRSFEALTTAHRIWDVTATAAVDRVTQRTTASSVLTRKPVTFDFASTEIIRSQYKAMRLGAANGRDLQIYPGFVLMRDETRDFALIEFAEFNCHLAQSNFIEEEAVPADAEQIGSTWKRANKDGSRDLRFNDNYQIPVMRYGALALSSPTGLAEVFQISNYATAADYAQAVAAHKRALANLNNASNDALALPAPSGEEDEGDPVEPAFVAKPRKNLAIDWITLALLVVGAAAGGTWTTQHWDQINAAMSPHPPQAQAAPVSEPAPPTPVKHKTHRRHRRAAAANASLSSDARLEPSTAQAVDPAGSAPN